MKRTNCIILFLFCALLSNAQAKYIFYFIGDGMGSNHVLATEMYQAELCGQIGYKSLRMTQFPFSGQLYTYSTSNGITDSSAAGTCLATGKKTSNGTLGLDVKGNKVASIAEILKSKGWGIGIMTTVAIDHATPGAFYAHTPSRSDYYEIGTQLSQTNYDFFGGAGFHYPQGKKDDQAINLYDLCEKEGYTFAHGTKDAENKLNSKKLILLRDSDGIDRTQHGECLPYGIDRKAGDLRLEDIVRTSVEFLGRKGRPFFMMVEGGEIDYASHGQDGATAIREVQDMDSALEIAYQFYLKHPDETTIIVTADHETGGLAIGNSDYTLNLKILQHQHCSAWILSDEMGQLYKNNRKPSWQEIKSLLSKELDFYGSIELTKEENAQLYNLYKQSIKRHKSQDIKTLYKDINQLSGAAVAILNKRAKLGWTSYSHTAHAVPVFAIGVGAERFTGWHNNSEIAPLLLEIAQ